MPAAEWLVSWPSAIAVNRDGSSTPVDDDVVISDGVPWAEGPSPPNVAGVVLIRCRNSGVRSPSSPLRLIRCAGSDAPDSRQPGTRWIFPSGADRVGLRRPWL